MPTRRKANIKLPGKKVAPGILTGSQLRGLKAANRLSKLRNVFKK